MRHTYEAPNGSQIRAWANGLTIAPKVIVKGKITMKLVDSGDDPPPEAGDFLVIAQITKDMAKGQLHLVGRMILLKSSAEHVIEK